MQGGTWGVGPLELGCPEEPEVPETQCVSPVVKGALEPMPQGPGRVKTCRVRGS